MTYSLNTLRNILHPPRLSHDKRSGKDWLEESIYIEDLTHALSEKYANRILPTRYLGNGKIWGDEHDNGLEDINFPKHLDAQTRWIIQGFHDPDIEKLQRSVPTPETADVPLTLLMIASLRAVGFCTNVKGVFTQSKKRISRRTHFL